jgi:hypothetical protein
MDRLCKIAFNGKILRQFKSVVNFQVALKQSYATEVTIIPACIQRYGFASFVSFCSFNFEGSGMGGEDTCHF